MAQLGTAAHDIVTRAPRAAGAAGGVRPVVPVARRRLRHVGSVGDPLRRDRAADGGARRPHHAVVAGLPGQSARGVPQAHLALLAHGGVDARLRPRGGARAPVGVGRFVPRRMGGAAAEHRVVARHARRRRVGGGATRRTPPGGLRRRRPGHVVAVDPRHASGDDRSAVRGADDGRARLRGGGAARARRGGGGDDARAPAGAGSAARVDAAAARRLLDPAPLRRATRRTRVARAGHRRHAALLRGAARRCVVVRTRAHAAGAASTDGVGRLRRRVAGQGTGRLRAAGADHRAVPRALRPRARALHAARAAARRAALRDRLLPLVSRDAHPPRRRLLARIHRRQLRQPRGGPQRRPRHVRVLPAVARLRDVSRGAGSPRSAFCERSPSRGARSPRSRWCGRSSTSSPSRW